MKAKIYVGFKDSRETIEELDRLADEQGLNRSNYLRQTIREAIHRRE